MHKLFILFACFFMFGAAATVAFDGNAQETTSTMLSRLQVGQRVKLSRAISGGYNVDVLTERQIRTYERTTSLPDALTIVAIRPDYIVVTDHSVEQAIAAHAIDIISSVAADPNEARRKGRDR